MSECLCFPSNVYVGILILGDDYIHLVVMELEDSDKCLGNDGEVVYLWKRP